jgi:Rrf2 family iron-sulfur cluster assembly transcriptional regulator
MLLTTKGRYAAMAMVDLALNANKGPISLAIVAERQGIDKGYLEQIFIKLKQAALVEAVRGPGGGYKIKGDPTNISIADIMAAVEEELKMTRCNKTESGCLSDKKSQCVTHHLWAELESHIMKFFKSITLFEICTKANLKGKINC